MYALSAPNVTGFRMYENRSRSMFQDDWPWTNGGVYFGFGRWNDMMVIGLLMSMN